MKGFKDLKTEELSGEDYGMLFSYYLAQVHSKSGVFTAIEEGILPASFGASLEHTTFFNNDIFRSMWPLIRREFDDAFADFFEQKPWNTGN